MSTTYYRVQVGAYSQKENADNLVKKLKSLNFPASVITTDVLHKVISGSFTVKKNAEKRLKDIQSAGFTNAFISEHILGGNPVIDFALALCKESNPHQKVIDILKKYGYTLKKSEAWCSETVMAILLSTGNIDKIGGFSSSAPSIKKKAKKLGIWHDGSSSIKAGDIVLYGSGEPNHTEIAVDDVYNVSGNTSGTVKKRKRAGRKINGYVRPKY